MYPQHLMQPHHTTVGQHAKAQSLPIYHARLSQQGGKNPADASICIMDLQREFNILTWEQNTHPDKGGSVCLLSCGALGCITILLVGILHKTLELSILRHI